MCLNLPLFKVKPSLVSCYIFWQITALISKTVFAVEILTFGQPVCLRIQACSIKFGVTLIKHFSAGCHCARSILPVRSQKQCQTTNWSVLQPGIFYSGLSFTTTCSEELYALTRQSSPQRNIKDYFVTL